MVRLRDVWEETSFQLERLQANPKCVEEEASKLSERRAPPFRLTYDNENNTRLAGLAAPSGMFQNKTKISVMAVLLFCFLLSSPNHSSNGRKNFLIQEKSFRI